MARMRTGFLPVLFGLAGLFAGCKKEISQPASVKTEHVPLVSGQLHVWNNEQGTQNSWYVLDNEQDLRAPLSSSADWRNTQINLHCDPAGHYSMSFTKYYGDYIAAGADTTIDLNQESAATLRKHADVLMKAGMHAPSNRVTSTRYEAATKEAQAASGINEILRNTKPDFKRETFASPDDVAASKQAALKNATDVTLHVQCFNPGPDVRVSSMTVISDKDTLVFTPYGDKNLRWGTMDVALAQPGHGLTKQLVVELMDESIKLCRYAPSPDGMTANAQKHYAPNESIAVTTSALKAGMK